MIGGLTGMMLLGELHLNQQWPVLLVGLFIVAAVGVSIWLYRGESELQKQMRPMLGILRILSMMLLILVLLEPSIRTGEEMPVSKRLIVMVDVSESMGIRDTRKAHEDLIEAALATGEIKYEHVEVRRLVARAERHMMKAVRALKAGKVAPAVPAQRKAAEALEDALAAVRAVGVADSRVMKIIGTLEELKGKQDRLFRETEAVAVDAARQREIADKQDELKETLAAVDIQGPSYSKTLNDKAEDRLSQMSRMELVKSILGSEERNFIGQLEGDYEIKYCRFDECTESVAEGLGALPDAALDKLEVTKKATYLGSAIEEAIGLHGGSLVAGVVVFTDGSANGGASVDEIGNKMGQRAIPIYPVGIGLAKPDDASIHNIVVQDVAFSGDQVPVRVQIHSDGYEKRNTNLKVSLDGRQLARTPVKLKGGPQFEDIFFDAYSPRGGAAKLEIALEPLPNEATVENNRIQRTIRMMTNKVDVLCIEGDSRWEYRYLRSILKRDPRLNVKFISTKVGAEIARVSQEYIARYPSEKEDAYAYDLVILGDVAASFFEEEEFMRMQELVRDRGGSLLMLAGRDHTPFEYAGTPVEDMLPVRFDASGKWDEVPESVHPVLSMAGKRSMVMTLESPAEKNNMIWTRVKPLVRLPPVTELKPGAVALAYLSDARRRVKNYPLIAWHRYGSGKTMFIGTDRLWRLRYKSGDKYHWRLWSQTIQFLTLSRLLGEHQRIRIQTDRTIYRAGERVHIYANVLNEAYEPVVAADYSLYVKKVNDKGEEEDDGLLLHLKPEPGKAGLYQGYYTAESEGAYKLTVGEADLSFANVPEFHVSTIRREMTSTQLDEDGLRKLALASGGTYFAIADLPVLPEIIDGEPRTVSVVKESLLWDKWWVLLAFIGLVCLEWFLRRKNDLA